jgi:hypothetical protein
MDIYKFPQYPNALPEDPDESQFLASFTLDEHKALANIFDICARAGLTIPFFKDFSLDSSQVENILKIFYKNSFVIDSSEASVRSFRKMVKVLEAAENEKTGLIGYCD